MIANYNFYDNTQPKENKRNYVALTGVLGTLEESHTYMGEKYYESFVFCQRESKTVDMIPIIISETLLLSSDIIALGRVEVIGEIRTFYLEHKLKLYIHAFSIKAVPQNNSDTNLIKIEGRICKRPTYRVTPLGREISDLCVAVQRPCGKIDYIPCITWGLAAQKCSKYEVGNPVSITGRFQSREYRKNECTKTVFEISVREIKEFPED